jgi:hypothetical protein
MLLGIHLSTLLFFSLTSQLPMKIWNGRREMYACSVAPCCYPLRYSPRLVQQPLPWLASILSLVDPVQAQQHTKNTTFICTHHHLPSPSTPRCSRPDRSVPPPPAGFTGVGRGGEPDLWVEISIKVVFSKD